MGQVWYMVKMQLHIEYYMNCVVFEILEYGLEIY